MQVSPVHREPLFKGVSVVYDAAEPGLEVYLRAVVAGRGTVRRWQQSDAVAGRCIFLSNIERSTGLHKVTTKALIDAIMGGDIRPLFEPIEVCM